MCKMEQGRPGLVGPPSGEDMKPSWGREPDQGLLYLLPFVQLGLGLVISEISLA